MTFRYSADEHRYRAQTRGQRQMAGVTAPSFMCPVCSTSRAIAGRQRVGTTARGAARYICRHCAAPESA